MKETTTHLFFPYLIVDSEEVSGEHQYNLMLNSVWLGSAHVIERKLDNMYLLAALEIFPQFRRQGHGSFLLRFLQMQLKNMPIKLLPVGVLAEHEVGSSLEEIAATLNQNTVRMAIRTKRIVSFYIKRGFFWDSDKLYLVYIAGK